MHEQKSLSAVQAAAESAEEFKFISSIVSDLRDDTAKLVYADWLEERGDERSAFVRELVATSRKLNKGAKLPESSSLPRAWTNMLALPLLKGIIENDLIELKDEALRLARPIVSIVTDPVGENEIALGGSKFGGHPDLPNDSEWPTCRDGRLGFLGQIALSDLKYTQAGRDLPNDGLLSFFAYQSYNSGRQPGNGEPGIDDNDTRILYSPASFRLERRKPPADLDSEGNGIIQSCKLRMCEEWDLPTVGDTVLMHELEAMKTIERFAKRGENFHSLRVGRETFGHHLMGYSVHFRTDDPTPGPEWTHLLCLDSDDNLGWSWCDGQNLSIWVPADDLRQGTFNRVFGYAS